MGRTPSAGGPRSEFQPFALALGLLLRPGMKISHVLVTALLLVAAPAVARAQSAPPRLQLTLQSPLAEPGVDLTAKYDSGKTLRSFGMPLTAAGSALIVVGVYYGLKNGLHPCGILDNECTDDQRAAVDTDRRLSLFTLLGGLATLGAGIPLWAVGVHRMRDAQRMGFQPVSVAPLVKPTNGGLIAGIELTTF